MPSFELIITQVLYWIRLLAFHVCHLFNFVRSAFQAEKVHELNEEIGKLLAKAEQLGAEGNVDEAQKVLQEVEKVRTRKKDAEVSEGQSEKMHSGNGRCSSLELEIAPSNVSVCCLLVCSSPILRKNTETPCPLPVSSSRSCGCARCAPPTWACMTMTVGWPITLAGSCTWASSRSERSWTN